MCRLEIVAVHIASERARNAESAFNERSVDDKFRLLIRDLTRPPRLDLLPKRFEIALDPIDPDGKRIHDRKILRVLRKNRCELALKREVVANENAQAARQPKAHRFVIGVSNAD